jgi:PAS domain S-box-containing protein
MESPTSNQLQGNPDARQNQMAQVFRNFQQCIQHCQKAVFFTDAAGILQRVNPAFEKLTGFVSAESVGKDLSWMAAQGPTSDTYREIWQKIFENRVFRGTLEVCRRDGNSFKMELTAIPVRDTKGRITSLVCTGQDAREAEAIEAELRQARNVSTRVRDVSHDLNNALTVISGCAELALDGLSSDHSLWSKLQEIRRASQRACELGREMLACTRVETQGVELASIDPVSKVEQVAPGLVIDQGKPWPAETLLIVEDESVVRTATAEFLSGVGYQVLTATNGQEAIERIQAHPGKIHLVITDLVMPDTSGTKLAERLASVRPEAKVLFVSGYSEDVAEKQGVPDPSKNFLQKPFSFQALGDKVRELVREPVRVRTAGAGAD